MTWLGHEIILTYDQQIWALVVALFFALFGWWCGRPLWMSAIAACVMYPMACLYAINENAMVQLKIELCAAHPEIDRCAAYR